MSALVDIALPIGTTMAGGLIGWAASLANSRRDEYNRLTHEVRVGLEKLLASDHPASNRDAPTEDDLIQMKASLRAGDRNRIAPKATRYLTAQQEAHVTDEYSQPKCSPEQKKRYLSAAQQLRDALAVK